jgi:plasmid stability protein
METGILVIRAGETTLESPDELMREIKIRAAREDRKPKDLVAELLRAGLERDDGRDTIRRGASAPVTNERAWAI